MKNFVWTRGVAVIALAGMWTAALPVSAADSQASPAPMTTATTVPQSPATAPAASATITGSVKTASGAGVPGAKIALSGPTEAAGTTDATGAFSFSVVPGIYRVSVDKGGFLSASVRDVTVLAGESQPLAITLSPADLSSLRTIGSVQVGRNGGSTINTGAATTTFIPAQSFTDLANPQINDVLQRAPDVTIQHMGSQADTTVIIGGAQPYETQVLIDGHPLALGQYGVWASQYFPSFLIGGAEIQSGPGNTTPFANIAVGGTLNLLSPTFTARPSAELSTGIDSYGSQMSTFLATGTVSKLGYVVGIGTASTNGPNFSKPACAVSPDYYGAGDNLPGNTGIIQFCGSMSGPLFTNGDVLKLRYAFTPSTSFEAGFVGAWSGFNPQGSAWGNSIGATTIEECQQNNPLACTGPLYQGYVGKTINAYVWYPGSSVYNNQTLFDGQFRTSLGNNTLLIRPYIGAIEPEAIVGSEEGAYPAFYSPVGLEAGTLPNGTPIPANLGTAANPGTAFEQFCGVSNIFAYNQINSPTNTSVVKGNQQECFQYPYSAFEQDKLYGTTFSFLHPFGDSLLNFTYDYHGQSVFAYFNAPTNISVPLSSNRYSTLSLTGYLHLIRNLAVNVGLYDTRWTVSGVQPQLDATGAPVLGGDGVPNLVGLGRGVSRFDPHAALVFRPTSSVSYRASYGTSATFPFLGQVSGNASFQPFASSAPQYSAGVLTEKNPNLDPEVSIAEGVGVDKRLGNGAILSLDLQNTVIHNVFETLVQSIPVGTAVEGVTAPINVARLRSQLATLKYTFAPTTGLGYSVNVAAERSMVDGIPSTAYPPPPSATNFTTPGFPVNDVQICGNGLVTPGIPTCIPYLKAYGQITYQSRKGTFLELGVDYEGKNNSYFQPPFAVFDATLRQELTRNTEFTIGVQNLLNTNAFDNLPAPNAGVPLVGAYSTGQGTYNSTLIPYSARTVRAQVRLHVGR